MFKTWDNVGHNNDLMSMYKRNLTSILLYCMLAYIYMYKWVGEKYIT